MLSNAVRFLINSSHTEVSPAIYIFFFLYFNNHPTQDGWESFAITIWGWAAGIELILISFVNWNSSELAEKILSFKIPHSNNFSLTGKGATKHALGLESARMGIVWGSQWSIWSCVIRTQWTFFSCLISYGIETCLTRSFESRCSTELLKYGSTRIHVSP